MAKQVQKSKCLLALAIVGLTSCNSKISAKFNVTEPTPEPATIEDPDSTSESTTTKTATTPGPSNNSDSTTTTDDTTSPQVGGSGVVAPTNPSPVGLELYWSAAQDNSTESTNLLYEVVYSTSANISTVDDAVANGIVAVPFTQNLTSAVISGLQPATTYTFAVIVKDSDGNKSIYTVASASTSSDTVAPVVGAAGAVVVSSESASGLTLTWTAASDDVTDAATLQYEVRQSSANNISTLADAEANGTVASAYSTNTTSVNITGLSSNTTYYFTVIVKDASGNKSVYVAESALTTIDLTAQTVANLVATASDTQVSLTWNSLAGTTSYNLYWNTSGSPTKASSKIAGVSSGYVHTGLTNGQAYYYIVTAENGNGESLVSATANATPLVPIPATPTGVSALSYTSAAISWSAVSGATSYTVKRSTTSGSGYATLASSVATTSYSDTTGTFGTTYYYVVSASNTSGESGDSAEIAATRYNLTPTVRYFDATDDDGDGTGSSGSIATSTSTTFVDKSGAANGTLSNFNFNTATSGWDGDGSIATPYQLKFDGTDDRVGIGSVTAKSYSIWFNASLIDGTTRHLFNGGFLGRTDVSVQNGLITMKYANAVGLSTGVDSNKWHHLAITNDGATAKYYLDGIIVGTESTGADGTGGTTYIGSNYQGTAGYFKGSVAIFRVYSQTLSNVEVDALYNGEKGRFGTFGTNRTISGIATTIGPLAGGTNVTINGTNLSGVTSVTFGGIAATTFTVNSNKQISATAPAGSAGSVDIAISDGTSTVTVTNAYTYTSDPTSGVTSYFDAANIDSLGAHGNGNTSLFWSNLVKSTTFPLMNVSQPASATSGWDGDGTIAAPYQLRLDGIDDRIYLGNIVGKTFSAWFNASQVDSTARYIFHGAYLGRTGAYVQNGLLYLKYNNGNGSTTAIDANRWHHIAMTNDGTTAKYYLDDVLFGLETTGADTTGGSTYLGSNYQGNAGYFKGSIANFRAYSAALTGSEVDALYISERTRFSAAPGSMTVSRVVPVVGTTAGGDAVAINGWGLDAVNSVTIGGIAATSVTAVSGGLVTAVTPALAAGYHDIVISDGTSTITETAAFRATDSATDSLLAYFDAANIDGLAAKGSSIADRYWQSSAPGNAITLNNFALPTDGTTGWTGAGTTGDPYRLMFNGTSTTVDAGSYIGKTYSVWFNASTNDATQRYVLNHGTTSIYLQNGNVYAVYNSSAVISTAVSTGTWYNLVITDDNTTFTAYLNGSVISSSARAYEAYQALILGSNAAKNANFFAGSIVQLRIYSRALSGAEVTTLYNAESSRFP